MYKSTIVSHKINIGFIAYFFVCLVIAFNALEVGLIAIALGVGVMTYKSGIELDTEKRRYRRFTKLLGYDFGSWRPLPLIKYVTVVRIQTVSNEPEDGRGPEVEYQYRLMLAVEGHMRVIKLSTLDLNTALTEAMKIGEALNLRVYDCSFPDKKWIR